jgi:cytochrome c oxidase subunit I+III
MVITLIVAGMVAVMAGFSYVFLWSRRPDLWQAPPETGTLIQVVGLCAAAALLAWAALRALALDRPRSGVIAAVLMLLAGLAIGAGWAVEASAWWGAGLRPQASGQGATVFALIAWQGMFAALCAIMAVFALMRWIFGLLSARRPATYQLIALFIGFSAAQGTAAALLTHLFPGG